MGSRVRVPYAPPIGSLAQLNRAFDYGSKGYRFESCGDHKDARLLNTINKSRICFAELAQLVERWLPKPKVTSSSLAFRSEKTAKVIHLGRFCFTKDGIFCTRKGLRTYIFYPVKQLKIALTGMQNFAHLKQLPFDRQQVGVPGALIFAHLRVGDPGTERSIGVPDFQVRVVYRT